ncbi:MAG: monovalent cation/H(+) antiporter subunit G [Actinobacteria bacterium]|jgi:multicomponent Na+:H+ antiporter subunit G|nr:monovalent cation/H(+) antiporter subunit G [Actinomycetota bacterium]
MTPIAQVLVCVGALLIALAAVGVLRLPDVYLRMHAATKAASLGIAFILSGAAILLDDGVASVKLFVAIVFQFATAPVAAHVIGRAAYKGGVNLWKDNRYDELEGAATEPDDPVTL